MSDETKKWAKLLKFAGVIKPCAKAGDQTGEKFHDASTPPIPATRCWRHRNPR
jgi:hypothetical protein